MFNLSASPLFDIFCNVTVRVPIQLYNWETVIGKWPLPGMFWFQSGWTVWIYAKEQELKKG